jgi:hypothetical protein
LVNSSPLHTPPTPTHLYKPDCPMHVLACLFTLSPAIRRKPCENKHGKFLSLLACFVCQFRHDATRTIRNPATTPNWTRATQQAAPEISVPCGHQVRDARPADWSHKRNRFELLVLCCCCVFFFLSANKRHEQNVAGLL